MSLRKGSVRSLLVLGAALAWALFLLLPRIADSAVAPPGGNIDPASTGAAYAWGENIGWINFKPTAGPGVTVTDAAVTGMAWGENVGWIDLGPADAGVVNDGIGHLSGYAWGENSGWIDFGPTNGGVTINGTTGIFSGYAWGENSGWINFGPFSGAVTTSWRAPAIAHLLTVTTTGNGAGTATSNPAGIDCGEICTHYYAAGAAVTLSPAAGTDSYFAGWGGACSGTGGCTVTMDAARTVTATFTRNPRTLNVNVLGAEAGSVASTSPSTAINCGSACSAAFAYGATVTLTAVPRPGGSLVGWVGCDSTSGLSCTVAMTRARTVSASFVFPLSVTEIGTGTGTVTSDVGGITCTGNSGTCTGDPPIGATVTLTATPAAGSIFAGWLGEGCSGIGTCSVAMHAARNVLAIFSLIPGYDLTVSKVGTGTGTVTSLSPAGRINCGAVCSGAFEVGSTVVLHPSADAGSLFGGWGGACTGTDDCYVTMTRVRSVTATFNPAPGPGAAYEVIHHFVGSPSVGAHRLLEGGDGFLYGSGKYGGTNGSGIIFKMRPDGSEFETLREYPSWNAYLYATTDPSALVLGSDGVLYGVTEFGGTGADYGGPGTIFKINRDGTGYDILHDFNGTTEGSRSLAALIQASNGRLYGATQYGPNGGNSVLFSLVPGTNQFTIIHSFADADGQQVYAALREGIDHKLYGIAAGGGANGYGTVFRLNLDGSGFQVIHSFDSVVGGGASYGPLVQGADGTLYGTTSSGGTNGAIFKLRPDGSDFTVLHLVDGYTEGIYLYGGVVLSGDGTLYGSAQQTGYGDKRGTVYAMKTDGSRFTTLHTFVDEAEGWWPWAGLLLRGDGSVYGTTQSGGTGTTAGGTASHGGVAFKISPPFTLNHDLHVSVVNAWSGHVISAPGGIDCYTECSAYFAPGSAVALTPIPSNGYVLTGWSGACSGTGVCTVTMDAARSVTATFDILPPPSTYSVAVTANGTGAGTITSSPAGLHCTGTCSAGFAVGSGVTLTATPATGSVFTGWSGACTSAGMAATCAVTMDAAKTVEASFASVGTRSLAVTRAGIGTGSVTSSPAGIACGTACATTFTAGRSVTLTASPHALSAFAGWSGEGCTGSGTCTVSLTRARQVTATFQDANPLVPQTTAIKALHFTELRTALNAVRGAHSLAPFNWTAPTGTPAAGGAVKAAHLTELRAALTEVYQAIKGTPPTYAEQIVAGTTPIKASHVAELRMLIRSLE